MNSEILVSKQLVYCYITSMFSLTFAKILSNDHRTIEGLESPCCRPQAVSLTTIVKSLK